MAAGLKPGVAAIGLAAAVAAFTVAADGTGPRAHPLRIDASGLRTRWPIKHVVFIVKENRSFDEMFGRFPGADGATAGRLGDRTVPLRPGTDGYWLWASENVLADRGSSRPRTVRRSPTISTRSQRSPAVRTTIRSAIGRTRSR